MPPRQTSLSAILLFAAASAGWLLGGCGSPAPPLPPSLKLPRPVADLAAERVADTVALRWTMPTETTDKMVLKGTLPVEVCRRIADGPCVAVARLQLAPGAEAQANDALGPEADAGAPKLLTYTVSIFNTKHRTAGASNTAYIAGGAAPLAPTGLSATASKRGVVLRWQPVADPSPTEFLAERELVASATPAPPRSTPQGAVLGHQPRQASAPPAPPTTKLRIAIDRAGASSAPQSSALDATARFGDSYRYTLQSVFSATLQGHIVRSLSAPSNAVSITPINTFPPSAPQGLDAALLPPATPGAGYAVDLSWTPNSEPDLVGYIVYRREEGGASPVRVSPAQPLPAPGFSDASVEPGRTYLYSVSAVDAQGNESARSPERAQRVPAQQ